MAVGELRLRVLSAAGRVRLRPRPRAEAAAEELSGRVVPAWRGPAEEASALRKVLVSRLAEVVWGQDEGLLLPEMGWPLLLAWLLLLRH